ncbi:MAG: response regulator [Candidatus Cloacimonetes bacterium]|nr:response regulator [Candidatus Cloacimonadota bacterium]
MKNILRVLLLEDSSTDGQLIQRHLKKAWHDVDVLRIFKAADMEKALLDSKWDIIISDYSMPQFNGLDALAILKASKKDIPLIMISGKMGEEEAVSVMRAGAQDYILKDNLDRIIPAIERELSEWETRYKRKTAEKALQETELAWEQTFTAIADSIMLLDARGKVKHCNLKALEIFGLPEEEMKKHTCFELLTFPEDKYESCPYYRMEKSLRREIEEIRFNNCWYILTLDPILDENGKLINAVHIMKDVTKHKQAEVELREAHKKLKVLHQNLQTEVERAVSEIRKKDYMILQQTRQAAIGEMLSRIAHHWRQPLNLIGVTIQALGEAFNFGELSEEYLYDKINASMSILNELSSSIEEFRTFYKQDSLKREFSIRNLMVELLSDIRARFEHQVIKIELDMPSDSYISGFAAEFYQALQNIITNACEILIIREVKEPCIKVNCKEENGKIIISISDNGGGIEPSIRDYIFELYTSTKKNLNNTGTGLYMSQLIIEKNMGGKIEVIDHKDGAEFKIIL